MNDTIAAISTPPGRGGIGIVRLSGPKAVAIAATLLLETQGFGELERHGRARLVRVIDPEDAGKAIDDALVTVFHAPHSATGEDVVEIALHGSPVVLDVVLRGALVAGARLAEPGEFTERAFVAGKIDLTQAEAIHDLIAARTLEQVRLAAQQMGGAVSRRLAPAKEKLLHLIALLEAGMDFASGELDDVDVVPSEQIGGAIAQVREDLERLRASFRGGQLLREGATLALAGLPNAGKSSLFNRLLERDRAIVTPLPGTTRDTLEESFALGGIPLRLIDTAGLRSVSAGVGQRELDPVEALGIARSHETLADADLVLFLHDASQPFVDEERRILAGLEGRPHLLVFSKSDLVCDAGGSVARLSADVRVPVQTNTAVLVSAISGEGVEALQQAILRVLQADGGLAETGALTTHRQREALEAALAALAEASAANESGMAHEALLLDLHGALRALDSLTGQTTTEDILGRIFSSFCIGK